MLVTFLNRQLFWIVSVNLKNTNTEGKRDHTLNLPGKKKHVSDNRNKLGILRVHPSTQRQCCRWAGWCRWQRVRPRWVQGARLRLTGRTSHSDQPLPHWGAETETVRDSQHSCNQTKCCVLYHRGKSPPDDAAVADRRLCRLLLRQGAAGPPLLPGAHSGLFAGVWALPPGHDRPRSWPPSLKANPGTGRLGGDIQPTGPLWILARVAAGAPPIQAVWGGDVAHLAVPLI